jgi:hypothetical protein
MKNRHLIRLLGLASLGAAIAAPAPAQDSSYCYYGGGALGRSNTDTDAADITAGLLPGASAASRSTDQKDTT